MMSSCLGIPTSKVDALTFALGSGLAGIAGAFYTVQTGKGVGFSIEMVIWVAVGGRATLVGGIVGTLLVEQHLHFVRQADKYYGMQKGGIVAFGDTSELSADIIQQFLSV